MPKLETVIFEISLEELRNNRIAYWQAKMSRDVNTPEKVTHGVSQKTYDGYRQGLVGACADVVLQSWNPQGKPVVLLIKRKDDSCFGGIWGIIGGSIYAYMPIIEFLQQKSLEECGLKPDIMALLGLYRTTDQEKIADTIQPCFLGVVTYQEIDKITIDPNHIKAKWVTLDDIDDENLHPYIFRVTKLALESAR